MAKVIASVFFSHYSCVPANNHHTIYIEGAPSEHWLAGSTQTAGRDGRNVLSVIHGYVGGLTGEYINTTLHCTGYGNGHTMRSSATQYQQ